ncbi:MAG: choice-of-anchor J domain-containing protein [Lentimicrobium sp.]
MKKQILFTTALLIIAVVANAQQKSTYWSEDFEGNWSTNWTISAGTWEVGVPASGPNAAHGGTQCAATILNGNYIEGVDSRLISQLITIPAAGENPRLRFWQWFSISAGDYGKVQVKTAGSSEWVDLSEQYVNTGSGVWSYPSLDLIAYAGQIVQFSFYFHSQDNCYGSCIDVSSGWYIDDISIVTGTPVFNNPQTWESGIGDWSSDKGTWEVGLPTGGPGAAHGGTQCAGTKLIGNYDEWIDTRLISPVYTVPGANQNPRLRFWQWFSISAGDYGKVQVKTAGSSEWVDLSEQYVNTGSGVWSYPSLDLIAYAGQIVQFSFYFHSQDNCYGSCIDVSSGWYIDDISIVTGTPVFNNPQTWESGIGDWSSDKGTWEVGLPTGGPGAAHGGTQCAGTKLIGNYDEWIDTRLISPVYTVPGANQNPRLRFWQWFSISAGDYGKVQVKTAGSSEWVDLSEQYVNTGSGVWSYPSLDLIAYAGQIVQFSFYFHSQDNCYGSCIDVSSGWYIDDISIVTGTPVFNNPQTWESGIGDWSSDKGTWEVGLPTGGPGAAHGGTQCAGTKLIGNYDEWIDTRLISPVYTVPGANQNPRLRFWQWFSISAGDYGKVQVKTAGSSEWVDLSEQYVNTGSGVWSYPSLDLIAYAGQIVQFSFYFHSQDNCYGSCIDVSSGWYIDDISIVTGTPVFNNPQTWESGIGDWSSDKGTWEVGLPTGGPGAAHGGTQCAGTKLIGNYDEWIDTRLISPVYTVPGANQNPRLRFWQWFSISAGDYGKVQVKTAGSSEWVDLSEQYVNTGSGVWSYPSLDLIAYAGQIVQFSFYFHSQDNCYGSCIDVSSGWYIDDISIVTGTPVFNNPQTWESGIGDWSSDKGTWEVGLPTGGPGAAHGGTQCAGTKLIGNYDEWIDTRLISPVYTVPGANQNPRLRFWQWFSISAGDYGKVQVKTAGSSEWVDLSEQYVNTGSGVWSYPSLDLIAYAGQIVQFSFYFHSQDNCYGSCIDVSSGWYIDDISIVTGTPVFNNPQTWESGIGDWSSDKGTWEVGLPTGGPGAAHGGTQCAGTKLIGNYDEWIDTRLISPVYTVPGANQNPRLRFWQWFSISAGDYGKVQVKTAGSSEWVDLSEQYVNTGSGVWSYPSLDLIAYAGQIVQFSFYFHSQDNCYGSCIDVSSGWYIDDISIVTGTPVFNNPQTWESGIGDWSSDKGTWEVGLPTGGPGAAHGGTQCAGTKLIGNYDEWIDTRLISPVYTVPGANQNPRLRFWQWFSISAGDYGKVQVKTAGSSEWVDLSEQYVNTGSGVWSYPSLDLIAYAGQIVQFSFYFHSQDNCYGSCIDVSSGWYIDDISIVTGTPVFNNPQTWESGIGDWSSDKGTWEVGLPTGGPGAAHGGTQCAGTKLIGNYDEWIDTRLISPVYTVPGANQNPRLRFWQWFSISAGDYGKVQVKTVGSSDWIDLSETYYGHNSSCNIWSNESLDLTGYAGQNVQFGFYFHSQDNCYGSCIDVNAGWYIDDISITDANTTPKILNINSVFIEGLYAGGGIMNKAQDENGDIFPGNTADQITIELHTAGCYVEKVYTIENVNLSTSGIASAALYGVLDGNYYITIKHRNSIETTSAAPVSFAGIDISYNFAISASQAYGSNQKDLNGNGSLWGLYSGDVSSISGEQDGYVDLFDLINVYNLNIVSASGYQPSDLTGDGYVDFIDLIIVYNNNVNSVGIITP